MTSTLVWITLSALALIHVISLRISVRLVGRGAENAWDNALGHLVVTGLLAVPVRWLWQAELWPAFVLVPPALAFILVVTVRFIYQVSTRRAVALSAVHFALSSFLITSTALITGAIAAYVMYGRIISDPLLLVRIVFRLIGIEPPF